MKRLLLFFVIGSCSFQVVNAQEMRKVMAIGLYNVENLFDTIDDTTKLDEDFTPNGDYHYTDKVYRSKLHNIATVLSQLGTDITPDGAAMIGLVEVENDRVLQDLVSQPELAPRNYKYVWHPTPDVRGISTAFLYNPKYFRLLGSQPVKVPLETLGQTRPTRNILLINGILSGNDTVTILVNHWPSRSSGEETTRPYRELAASVDRNLFDSIQAINPSAKIIIMGDLNDNPIDNSVIKVLKAKADTTDLAENDIYNPWIKLFKKGIGTEVFQDQWNLLDQIMISGSFIKNVNNKWRYWKNRIFNKEFLADSNGYPIRSFDIGRNWQNGYSDHFPVLIYLYK